MENNQQNLPPDIVAAINSSDVYTKLEKIGDRYGLLIDQLGYLNMYTEQIMIGKLKSKDFVPTVAKELEISQQTAEKITADINNEIFSALRESLRKIQEEKETSAEPVTIVYKPPIAPIEKAGQFTVVNKTPSASPLYNDHSLSKEEVLADLENINNLKPENATTFVEHLLTTPAHEEPTVPPVVSATPAPKREERKLQEPPVDDHPATEAKKYTADPYREAI
jgi:hypothetical protein